MVDFDNKVPSDGEVYALSTGPNHTRAEFIATKGGEGADSRVAWRLYDRLGRGILLTAEEVDRLCKLTKNYYGTNL